MNWLFKAFLLLSFLLFNFIANAQINDSDSSLYVPFDSISRKIEIKHQIKLFYNPEWFERKEFSESISKMPLNEAISLICKISDLSFSKLSDNIYVFIPITHDIHSADTSSNNVYEIGNIMEYGSKSHAQISISVINGSTSNPLVGSKIEVIDLKKNYETNQRGKISIKIPVGEHDIKIEYSGYETRIFTVKVYSDGNFEAELNLKTIVLNEVSVVATKVDQYFRRTKMSVMSIDAKAIKELPSNFGETDIIKSLSLMPGVQTTGEFGSGFNVRGGSSDQNLVLIEEVPLFNSSHLFGLVSTINPDGISKVTLYKGGIPVIYGERSSSILSIKMGNDDLKKVQVKGGIGLLNSRLSLEIPVKEKLKIIMGGRSSYSDWMLNRFSDLRLKHSSARFSDLNIFATYKISSKDELSVFAYNSNDYFYFSGVGNYYYGNSLGSINLSHRFNSRIYTNILAGISHYKSDYIENDTITPYESYKISNSLLYNNFKWNLVYKLNENHILTFGVNSFLYDIDPGKLSPFGEESKVSLFKIQNEKGLEWAGYVGDDYEINEKIGLEFGIRYSNFYYLGPQTIHVYYPHFTKTVQTITDSVQYEKGEIIKRWSGIEPRVLLRYNLNYSSSIRASFNRINQYINLVSNTSVAVPTDLWKLSDNYLQPLICDQLGVGFFKNFLHGDLETSVEGYFKRYQNVTEYKNGAAILLNNHIETDLIKAKGISYGAEFFIKKNSGKLSGWISYTISKSLRRTVSNDPAEQVNNNSWYNDNLDRPHNLVINSGYYINKRWKLGLTFNYNTGRPVTIPELTYTIKGTQIVYYSDRNKYRMPDYHRLDFSISHFESLKLNKKWKSYWTISLINVYGRKNAYSFYYKRDHSPYNYDGRSNLYKLYIIGRPLPTFTYNFVF